ncbi:hypothetical protein JTB14_029127 [Gonioctena quinquepunctata]|nr:hypothetical protein JTB14_029127 [Gonioctena quinquepunctata]
MNSSGRDDKREQATRTANEIQDVSNEHSRTSDGGLHQSNCGKCGLKHRYRECPAFGKQCRRCFQFNHFCNDNFHSGSTEIFMIENSEHNWYETLYIPACGKYSKFKLDTGAHVDVIPGNIWRILKIGSLKKIKLNITNYKGQTLRVVFNGIGEILSSPVNFQLKRDYQPKVVPCRRVPFHLMEKPKAELDIMISDDIITKVKKPTEFVNPIVIVK